MSEQKNDNQLLGVQGEVMAVESIEKDLSNNTDLIQRAIDGEKKAFEQLYMQSYRYVFFVVRRYIPDDETTYDVIQETFIKVFKGLSDLRSPNAYYSWLTTIAQNTAKNFLRSKHVEDSITEEEDYSVFLKQDQTQKDVELDIEAVLKELKPQDAELLSLVYYDGMRVTQIAKMRGVPAATVYTQLNRAKRNLKSQLAVHGIDKSVYSGDFVAMIATSIRNIIGTALLSVAVAQQILNSVVNGKVDKEIAVAKVIKQLQKKNVLNIASCIVAISMITTIITVVAILGFGKNKSHNHNSGTTSSNQSVTLSSPESNDTQQDGNTQQNGNTQTETNDNTHGPSSSENSSQGDTQDDTVVDGNQNPNSSDTSDSSNNSSNTQSQPTTPPDDEQPPTVTAATYTYRDATAEDCYTEGNIPAQPIEDVIVITGVATAESDGIYNIPETIDGKRVGAIMPSAFCDAAIKDTVKAVVVPSTVRTIWQKAFSECYNLTDIYLRGSYIDIFENAFADQSMRTAQLTIHCSNDCKTLDHYYYRNIAENYAALYKKWDGEDIK